MHMPLKAISAILSYPTEEFQAAAQELKDALAQGGLLTPELIDLMSRLVDDIAGQDIYEVQERYVSIFDRSRTLSLNLFEHVHGESRDRGPAMVDLVEMYRAGGFDPIASELPDHLPVLLEFLASRPLEETKDILGDTAHILENLQTRLTRRESVYAAAMAALQHIAGVKADAAAVEALLSVPDEDPDDLEALDAVWEEAEVTFGPDPSAGCPQVRDILSNLDQPVNQPTDGNRASAAQ
ncbi:nitrate reductase molybdenum cofactor assembly chaperone [Halocynthiibacter namhaensis]|uniref:nitrate reductase molybdenum cofactor assembly chaperone n=1 Tax=Halocynthiibacter namhaensis TaxID=1290553 RepID=UPI0005792057|nr:nitrate reductase molybdenum cofactor assembly chaperone [Halocynthiibacter namhaensis]